MYAELSFFDGAHFQHIADYYEHKRLERLERLRRQDASAIQRQMTRRSRFAL